MRPNKQKVFLIAGARPNFMKIAPIYWAMAESNSNFIPILIHTGQHYDKNMSGNIFKDLDLPDPEYSLGIGAGSHAKQTSGIMIAVEELCIKEKPDWVVVVGDVNSTVGAALAAAKLNINVAHVEAGLRSYDKTMPEETNRLVVDAISDLLLTPSLDANENLEREGQGKDKIVFVGNVMIDSLVAKLPEINKIPNELEQDYALVTMHRPSNVDNAETLSNIVDALIDVSSFIPVLFPIHPRTLNALDKFNLKTKILGCQNIHLREPQGYIKFISWAKNARLVITDSGGIQEETTWLKTPCLTVRENTERPITITQGTNKLIAISEIVDEARQSLATTSAKKKTPEYWDGLTAKRILEALSTTG